MSRVLLVALAELIVGIAHLLDLLAVVVEHVDVLVPADGQDRAVVVDDDEGHSSDLERV